MSSTKCQTHSQPITLRLQDHEWCLRLCGIMHGKHKDEREGRRASRAWAPMEAQGNIVLHGSMKR